MKCPECGAWTSVKETRGIRRRRECGNEHRFTTEEVIIPEEVLKERRAENIKTFNREQMVALRKS